MPTMETVIDPINQKINVVKHKGSGIDVWRELIGCQMLTFVNLYENGDGVYLDDEGLYSENQHFWIHRNYPQPLVGKAIHIGTTDEGESRVPQTSYKQLCKDVVWCGSRFDLSFVVRCMGDRITTENGYEDYRPIFFPES